MSRLLAPILASDTQTIGSCSLAGFGPDGIILSKQLTADDDNNPASA